MYFFWLLLAFVGGSAEVSGPAPRTLVLNVFLPHSQTSFQSIQDDFIQLLKSYDLDSRWSLLESKTNETGTMLTLKIEAATKSDFFYEQIPRTQKGLVFQEKLQDRGILTGDVSIVIQKRLTSNHRKFHLQASSSYNRITCCACPKANDTTGNSTTGNSTNPNNGTSGNNTQPIECCACNRHCGSVKMTYSDATSVLAAVSICGIIYYWYKFDHGLPFQESLSAPKMWFVIGLPAQWLALILSIVTIAIPDWNSLSNTGTFSMWQFCPVEGSCIAITDLGCPVSGDAPTRNLQTIRAFAILPILTLAVASVLLSIGYARKDIAPITTISKLNTASIYLTFSSGCMLIVVFWLWFGYFGDIINSFPGGASFGPGFYLDIVTLGLCFVAAYFSAFGNQAILNIHKKRKQQHGESRAHAPSDSHPLVAGHGEGSSEGKEGIHSPDTQPLVSGHGEGSSEGKQGHASIPL